MKTIIIGIVAGFLSLLLICNWYDVYIFVNEQPAGTTVMGIFLIIMCIYFYIDKQPKIRKTWKQRP